MNVELREFEGRGEEREPSCLKFALVMMGKKPFSIRELVVGDFDQYNQRRLLTHHTWRIKSYIDSHPPTHFCCMLV